MIDRVGKNSFAHVCSFFSSLFCFEMVSIYLKDKFTPKGRSNLYLLTSMQQHSAAQIFQTTAVDGDLFEKLFKKKKKKEISKSKCCIKHK